MAFMVCCTDKPDGRALRRSTRAIHLEYMIQHKNLVLYGGPMMDESGNFAVGSLIVLDVGKRSDVEDFLSGEPYCKAGLFESVIIRPLRQMVPESRSGLLEEELQREQQGLVQA